MINISDIILYFAITAIIAIGVKMWRSLDKYFDKKAENLATKQDIAEITRKTETVQAEFHKILGKFDADLKFKYQFYENQYKELYSALYWKICESEALRYILVNLSGEHMDFCNVPIVEYESENSETENQMTVNSINDEIINLIRMKHIYASPELIKLVCILENIESYESSVDTKEEVARIECTTKMEIVRTILRDYYWLRQELRLQESVDETNKLNAGKFILDL